MSDGAGELRPLPSILLWGFAISCLGGPLALLAVELPDAVGGRALDSIGLVTLAGAALFVAPMLVWWRFSARIASSGGLYAFTRLAVGERVARVQGWTWVVSYQLYLGFTVTEVVYDLLPQAFPGVDPWRKWLLVGVACGLAAALVFAERAVLWVLLGSVIAQVVVMVVLAGAVLSGHGWSWSSFSVASHSGSVARGIANASLLFVCGSLPLFLGGEVTGGGRELRRIVAGSAGAVAVLLVVTAAPLAVYAGSDLAGLELPGHTVALVESGATLARWVAVVAIASVLGLMAAEFIALTRLLHAMTGAGVQRSARLVAAGFVALALISLIDPERLYSYMITPSLVALYVSQVIVFGSYGVMKLRERVLRPSDLLVTAVSCGLMLFGLEVVISQQPYF
ncbi:MAG: hypothetical protein QOF08_4 [Gaiellales bacterium]|nr:hypothetical protein [Gaiellales bacterium]